MTDVEEAATGKSSTGAPAFKVLVGSEEVQSKVVGFPFCRGALACGLTPEWKEDEDWLMEFLRSRPWFSLPIVSTHHHHQQQQQQQQQPRLRLCALDGVCDTANLGSMVRCASAFGLDALILSQDSCDVWYRKAVRVSMGHVCRIPCVRVPSLEKTIHRLQKELAVVSYAVIDKEAECVLEKMNRGDVPGAWCCVVGNEGSGISRAVETACSKRIRIGMEDGVDSLSVPVATGILLHGLKEREGSHKKAHCNETTG